MVAAFFLAPMVQSACGTLKARNRFSVLRGSERPAYCPAIAMTSNEKKLVRATYQGTIEVWDLEQYWTIHSFSAHEHIPALTLTLDEFGVFSCSLKDHTLRLWELGTGKEVQRFIGHEDCVWKVALTPVAKRVVSSSSDQTLRVWDVETGKCIRRLIGHSGPVFALAVMLDGERVVSGGWDGIRVWTLTDGRELCRVDDHTVSVVDAVLVRGDSQVISASRGCLIQLWELETMKELARVLGKKRAIGEWRKPLT